MSGRIGEAFLARITIDDAPRRRFGEPVRIDRESHSTSTYRDHWKADFSAALALVSNSPALLACSSTCGQSVEFLTLPPYMDELATMPFRPDDEGCLTVPVRPGLGIALNRDALPRFGIEWQWIL